MSEYRNMVTNESNNANNDHPMKNPLLSLSNIAFVVLYILTLIIVGFISDFNSELFVPWNQFTPIQVIQAAASILLCFFLPGYAIVNVVSNSKQFKPVPKVLLAYLFSVAITGFSGYLAAVRGFPVSEIKPELISVYIAILTIFIGIKWIKARSNGRTAEFENAYYRGALIFSIRKYSTELLVFGTLFAFF